MRDVFQRGITRVKLGLAFFIVLGLAGGCASGGDDVQKALHNQDKPMPAPSAESSRAEVSRGWQCSPTSKAENRTSSLYADNAEQIKARLVRPWVGKSVPCGACQKLEQVFEDPEKGIVFVHGHYDYQTRDPRVNLDIHFDYNSDRLRLHSKKLLDDLSRVMNAAQFARDSFVLIGHTDSAGGNSYNMDLSLRRALAVRAYLVGPETAEPVTDRRLTIVFCGEEVLLVPVERTAADMQRNRRVEVRRIAQ